MTLIFLGLLLAVTATIGLVTEGASVLPPLYWLALAGIGCAVVKSGLMLLRETR